MASEPTEIAPNLDWKQIAENSQLPVIVPPNQLRRPGIGMRTGFVVGGVILLLLGVAGAAVYLKRDQLTPQAVAAHDKKEPAKSPYVPTPVAKPSEQKGKAAGEVFPRRMLVVSINQYLYANPILFGSPKRSPAALMDRLSDKWRIPRDQLFLLTDAKNNRGVVPPVKVVVEKTISDFLSTSRSQDRIVMLYSGHATAVDGKAYLVPLDGELERPETLIPLSWLSESLLQCPAQQKLLIFDACRADPGRGVERPSPGPMNPALEVALKTMPETVQIWTGCAANQTSFEYQYQAFGGNDVEGSVFMNNFFHAFLKGGPAKQRPEDPLPIDDLFGRVDALTQAMVQGIEKQAQTPKLFGRAPNNGVPFDPTQPPAKRITVALPQQVAEGGIADPKVVHAIFAEIRCPPIKSTTVEQSVSTDEMERVFPFSADRLKDYAADYESVTQLLEHPDQHPFRVGVLKAVEVLERHGRGEILVGNTKKQVGLLREEFAGPTNDAAKKTILKEQHDGPAAMYLELEESLRSLEKLAAVKPQENSKRWLAHYDYVLALTKARFAYINEYNFALAKIRKDELPTIDPKIHKGWRLAAVEKMSSPREVKEYADDAKQLFSRLIQDHPGTPWEVLAKRDRLTALGLVWQPAAVKGK